MRLEVLNSGHAFPAKMKLTVMNAMMKLTMGGGAPDVVRLLSYRPEFFGRHFSDLLHDLLRTSKAWDTGRAELFAAFVSGKNKCSY